VSPVLKSPEEGEKRIQQKSALLLQAQMPHQAIWSVPKMAATHHAHLL
jgi:hypothetical protein